MLRLQLSLVIGFFLSMTPALAQQQIKTEKDVVYGKGGDIELKIDIAQPAAKSDKPRPCVLCIHGGAWRGGSKDHMLPFVSQLAQRGYVAATVQYRMVPKHRFPAQVEDVKCAVRFLRAHAKEYNLDPDRMGVAGVSAGAHLAMMLGTLDKADGFEGEGGHSDQSSQVQAVVSLCGPTDFSQTDFSALSQGLLNDFIGFTPEENAKLHRAASPITYVDKNDPPMLLFHGTKDKIVPITQATLMADAMSKAGQNGRVELLLNADHTWAGKEMERTLAATFAFLDEQLKK